MDILMWERKKKNKNLSSLRKNKAKISFLLVHVNIAKCCLGTLPSFIYIYMNIYIYISEKAMASHFSTLAWKIPWMEEPGRLQSMRLLRVRHD